ncbi:hypothetical protein [Kineococcus sp. SYSU DK003]|uniref:hypothetical protein n=1 Tax=Kineococcus sp. SYSU DK003 TaxID=3383124 RepID=UPI003D7D567C
MTVETHEDEARRMVMEISRRSITVTAHLAQKTWVEMRQFVSDKLISAHREPRPGRRMTPAQLEQATRGQRESVNLTDPRIAKLVQKELNRYGVTFAITRDAEGTRVHIGAGNATQLDTAMRRAEQTLARQLEAAQARADRRAGRSGASSDEAAPERTSTIPGEAKQQQQARTPGSVESPDRGYGLSNLAASSERYAAAAREALPAAVAEAVLTDSGWPVLAKSLAAAEDAGLEPAAVLGSVVRQRETFTSRSVAAVLAWRVDNAIDEAAPKLVQERSDEAAPTPEPQRSDPGREGLPALSTWSPEAQMHWNYPDIVEATKLPLETRQMLLSVDRTELVRELTTAAARGEDPVQLLQRAVGVGPVRADEASAVLPTRMRAASLGDARSIARSALNERARTLPKGDVVDLATEKPGRGLDLGSPRR